MKDHLVGSNLETDNLFNNGINLTDSKCNNKIIRAVIQKSKIIQPKCKSYWNAFFTNVNWEKSWNVPYKYCITNKIREIHFKILHKNYLTNEHIAKFIDIDPRCSFCHI